MSGQIEIDDHQQWATLTLVSDGAFYWNDETLESFHQHLLDIAREGQCQCLVLQTRQQVSAGASSAPQSAHASHSAGGFGGTLAPKMMTAPQTGDGARLGRGFAQAFGALRRFSGVSIALVDGLAQNEGLSLALNCDFRLASDRACFAVECGDSALLPMGGSSQLLPRLIGEPRAKRMLLLGESYNANQSRDLGLVDEITAPENLQELARIWVERITARPAPVLRAARQLVEHARMRPLETGFAAERDWQAQLMDEQAKAAT